MNTDKTIDIATCLTNMLKDKKVSHENMDKFDLIIESVKVSRNHRTIIHFTNGGYALMTDDLFIVDDSPLNEFSSIEVPNNDGLIIDVEEGEIDLSGGDSENYKCKSCGEGCRDCE